MEDLIQEMPRKVEAALSYGESMKNMDKAVNHNIKQEIKFIIMNEMNLGFEDVDVYIFGSRLMGLACQDSDLDIFVDLDNRYCCQTNNHASNLVKQSAEAFKNVPNFTFIKAIPKATIPILIVQHVKTRWNVDISFTNGLGVETSLFIKNMFETKPEAKKLAYYMCIWFKENKIEMKNFFLKVLVVYYLQAKNYMPSVKEIQSDLIPRYVGGCNTVFNKISDKNSYNCHPMDDYKQHLRSFFVFYANFDFRQYIVCLNYGKPIAKIDNFNRHINISKPMIVLSPLESNNLTKHFSSEDLNKFQENCRLYARLH